MSGTTSVCQYIHDLMLMKGCVYMCKVFVYMRQVGTCCDGSSGECLAGARLAVEEHSERAG